MTNALRAAAERALDWKRNAVNCGYDNWSAETPFGRILITWKGWKEQPDATVDEFPGPLPIDIGDPDYVRDKAEAEFWSRVDALAAEQPQPCAGWPVCKRCIARGTKQCAAPPAPAEQPQPKHDIARMFAHGNVVRVLRDALPADEFARLERSLSLLAEQPQPIGYVWTETHTTPDSPNGPAEYNEELCFDTEPPTSGDYTAVYAAPPAAAPVEVTDAMIEAAWKAMKVEPAVPMTTAVRERLRASIKAGIEAALREQGR